MQQLLRFKSGRKVSEATMELYNKGPKERMVLFERYVRECDGEVEALDLIIQREQVSHALHVSGKKYRPCSRPSVVRTLVAAHQVARAPQRRVRRKTAMKPRRR